MDAPPQRLHDTRSTALAVVWLLAIIMAGHFPVEWIVEHFLDEDLAFWEEFLVEAVVLGTITGSLAWALIIAPLRRSARAEHRTRQVREAQLRDEVGRQRFDATVTRALEMVETEHGTMEVLRRALGERMPDRPATLLLADSSDSHLADAMRTADDMTRCTVEEPRRCPAIRLSRAQVFPDSEAIDACPHLPAGQQVSALCIPMNAAGRAVGVLHAASPGNADIDDATVPELERLVAQTGARLGLLRVVERTALQAATDPLTGLSNRRVVEDRMASLLRRGVPFAVAMADLDHFKQLNDAHGHEAGDRALRLYATMLRSTLRSEDLASRYGGEEFLLVFPRLTAEEAADVVQRCREELLVQLGASSVPGFSASYGVADTSHALDLATLIATADRALFAAKRAGRDRIITADSATHDTAAHDDAHHDDAHEAEPWVAAVDA